MTSETVLIIQGTLYTVALFYFLIKYKMSVGAIIWFLYTVSAWATYLFVQQPMYFKGIHNSKQTLEPCIYMFIVNLIAMYPLVKFNHIPKIKFNDEKIIRWFMLLCIGYQVLFLIVDLPYMIKILTSPSDMLATTRNAGYETAVLSLVNVNVWTNKLSLLVSGVRILATGLSVYLVSSYKKYRKLVVVFFVTTLIENVRIVVVNVGRGEIVLLFLLYVSMFYSLRKMIDKGVYKKLLIAAIPVVSIGMIFFWVITISRFGEDATYTLYKYLGEPMNNFNGLLFNKIKGTTNGRAYFSLIYRYIFGQQDFINTTEKWQMINSMTGINGNIFYTWIGGLIIEFGKVVPIIVAIILNRAMNRVSRLKEYLIGDLIVVIFFVNFFIRGIFVFSTQNYEGIFMILYTILLYIVFRIRRNSEGRLVFVVPKKRL